MTPKEDAYEKIAEGLREALSVTRGEAKPYRHHDPAAHADEMEALSPGYKARREALKR